MFRRQSKNKPIPGERSINWEETVCLNIILQQIDYFVTCAVCLKSSSNLQIIRKNCQRVYPSPSRRRMDAKGECEEITYPKIYFAIDDFEQVFNDVIVSEGECVCVELIARDRYRETEAVVFLGSIKYDVLKNLYDNRVGLVSTSLFDLKFPEFRRLELGSEVDEFRSSSEGVCENERTSR